jgi:hypothetical protein
MTKFLQPSFIVAGPNKVLHDCEEHASAETLWIRPDGRCYWCGEVIRQPKEKDDANPRT